ncbi:MAG TPA: hypothetical protein VN541_24205, partial [Tepidisphaeraceae bacterium]|nr:hypothetical protein [Tepidisphaeraceae bacterium]
MLNRLVRPQWSVWGIVSVLALLCCPAAARAAGESDLILPDLHKVTVFGADSHLVLTIGIAIALLGIVFGLVIYAQLRR